MLTENSTLTSKNRYNIWYLALGIFVPFVVLIAPAYYYIGKFKYAFVLYIITENTAAIIGIALAVICFTYYFGVKKTYFLNIGLGFLLTGVIDFLQALFSFSRFINSHTTEHFYKAIDVFTIDSVVLCLFFCLAPVLSHDVKKRRVAIVFFAKLAVTLLIGAYIYFVLIWSSRNESYLEVLLEVQFFNYLGLGLFILALFLNYKFNDTHTNIFSSFLIICILFNIFAEFVYCISSISDIVKVVDFRPVAKLIGNFVPIVGILLYSLETIQFAESSNKQILSLKEKFQLAFEAGKVNVWGWDSVTNKINFFNNIKLFDLNEDGRREIDLDEYLNYIVSEDREKLKNNLYEVLTKKTIIAHEHRAISRSGKVYYLNVFAKPDIDEETGEATKIIGIALDITDRKKSEEEKNLILKKLNSSNSKLESYSSTISHDLKEPIRNIKNMGQFLKEDYCAVIGESGLDFIERIIDSSNKMHSMITDLLTLANIGIKDISYVKCNLSKILYELSQTTISVNKDRKIVINYSEIPEVICQPSWITMVFKNFLSNAVKFNDKDEVIINISCFEEGDKYVFNVKDNGTGIPKKLFDKIFIIFLRGHNDSSIEGYGAGLAIVKAIAKEHNGDAWVNWSQLKVGTEFCFSISKKLNCESLV